MTLFRCQVYLAGQRPTNWRHHFYNSKVDGNLSHGGHTHTHINTDMSPRAYDFMLLSEKILTICRC